MERLDFPTFRDCTLCPLHEQCSNVAIPTRYIGDLPSLSKPVQKNWDKLESVGEPAGHAALIVVGEAPGRSEDAAGASFVGWTGQLLHRWLTESYQFHELADIYLTNAARCYPTDKPTDGQVNKCRRYLLRDIDTIYDAYDGRVTILTMGAKATKSLTGNSVKKALVRQGSVQIPKPSSKAGDLEPYESHAQVPIFSTYHPAAVAPGRSPELVHVVEAHLGLVDNHLRGIENVATQQIEWDDAPTTIDTDEHAVALDIETYGILANKTQTVFHPHRMLSVDGIPYRKQVVSCALSYMKDNTMRNAFYNLYDPAHIRALHSALRSLRGHCLVGMNMAFDVTCLRLGVKKLTPLLTRENFELDDLAITNHLASDLRPERSLKSISRLLGKVDYESLEVSTIDGGHAAKSPEDPNLARYNVIDTINTLSIYRDQVSKLRERWGDDEYIDRDLWRSDLVWSTVHMQEHGMRFDRTKLQAIEDHLVRRRDRCFAVAFGRGLLLGGKGSEKSILSFIHSCLDEECLWDDPRLKLTKKTKKVSTGKENIEFLNGAMSADNPLRRKLKLLSNYRKAAKIVSSYTRKLLHTPHQGCNDAGMAYPSWFPVPAFVKDDHGTEGGTKQGRFSAHNPPAQTCPPAIKKAQQSRYQNGRLWSWDLSQIELRVLAILSGDPNMMDAYLTGKDIHWETARVFFGDLPTEKPAILAADQNEKRQLGKTANFLIVYRGGAGKLRETARRQIGLEISMDMAKDCIRKIREARHGVIEYQDRLIRSVKKYGYVECITGWRRTFVRDGYAVDKSSINEICNMPIQTYGAQILQSIQAEFLNWRSSQHLPCVMSAQIHDDIHIDMDRAAERKILNKMDELMREPPLWAALSEYTGRWIPLDYGREILYPRGTDG